MSQFEDARYMQRQFQGQFNRPSYQGNQSGNPPYHPNNRNHPNFSYSNPNNALQSPYDFSNGGGGAVNEPKVSLEEMMQQLLVRMTSFETTIDNKLASIETTVGSKMDNIESIVSALSKQLKMLETQVGQIAVVQHRPGHAEVKQKSQCNAISADTLTSRDEEIEKIAADEQPTPKEDFSIPHISAAIDLVSIPANPRSEYKLVAIFPCCMAKPNIDEKMAKFMEVSLKQDDPDSFIVACAIGWLTFSEVLWDLEVCFLLMPLFAFHRVGIG